MHANAVELQTAEEDEEEGDEGNGRISRREIPRLRGLAYARLRSRRNKIRRGAAESEEKNWRKKREEIERASIATYYTSAGSQLLDCVNCVNRKELR